MPVLPSQFDAVEPLVLLEHAAQGLVGFDHRLIRSLLNRPAQTLDALDAFCAAVRPDDLLDLRGPVFDLYRALGGPRALRHFLGLLERSEPGEIPDELVEAISVFGGEAVEPLLELKAKLDGDQQQGADIVFVLAALGVKDPRAAALFRETLARDPYEGAICIGLSGDASLLPDVEAALAALPPEASEERKALSQCAEALARPTLPDEPPRFDIYEDYPETALPLFGEMKVEHVLEFLDAADPDYRAQAAASFADEDYGDAIRARLLDIARSDPSPAVRGGAFRSLGERIAEPDVQRLLLERLAASTEPEERKGLLVGLAGASGRAEVRQALLSAFDAPPLRAAALEAMWRSLDEQFIPLFGPALDSEDPDVVHQAVQGVGAFPIPGLAAGLVPLFEDERLREDALFAYALAAPGKTSRKSAERLLEEIRAKAGGLSVDEEDLVAKALDNRLERAGLAPFFFPEQPPPEPAVSTKTGRNEPCPCGSGKKYKKCCGA